MKNYKVGTKLNIETDVFARYIDHILAHRSSKKSMGWNELDSMQMSFLFNLDGKSVKAFIIFKCQKV